MTAHHVRRAIVIACVLTAASVWPRDGYFATPESPFITAPGEEVAIVQMQSGGMAQVQNQLDVARNAKPEAVIVLKLSGTVTVTGKPLKLGSRTCVVFAEGARIVADTAVPALICIERAELISLSASDTFRGTLDGNGRAEVGIKVTTSGKVNIDGLDIANCATAGIEYTGRGADVLSDAGSITRCRVTGCGTGAHIRDAAQFVVVDSVFLSGRWAGIDIESPSSIVANNRCVGNKTGIRTGSKNGTVAGNTVRGNRVGLALGEATLANFVSYNRFAANGVGIHVNGERNSIYCNEMDNGKEFDAEGKDNVIAGHRDVAGEEVDVKANVYFNPPTDSNNHADKTIVNGLGRHDIEVQGGAGRTFHHTKPKPEPADLSVAQAAIDKARQEHPDDVIVAHLKGLFVATGPRTGLSIPANACVIVYGSIQSASKEMDWRQYPKETQFDTQVIKLADRGFASLSGGIIDGRFQPYHVINAPGKNTAIIDGVTVKAAGMNGITTKGHGGLGKPIFVRSCTVVDSANRGIWAHVSRDVHVIDNVCAGNISDGIDLDAYCMQSTALFNVCTGNRRHGIFVEEGVKDNLVFGNRLADNLGCGIAVWDEAVKGNTGPNALVCNTCDRNGVGVAVGGRSAEKTSNTNFFFNNVCVENRRAGLRYGNVHSGDNYFSQHVVARNAKPIEDYTRRPMTLYFAAPSAELVVSASPGAAHTGGK